MESSLIHTILLAGDLGDSLILEIRTLGYRISNKLKSPSRP